MADVGEIRQALADRLGGIAIPDMAGQTLRVSTDPVDAVNPPQVAIVEDDPFIDYDLVLERGGDVYNFTFRLYVTQIVSRVSISLLDTFRAGSGPSSIKAALEASWPRTDPSGIHFANVRNVSPASRFTVGQVDYLGCDFKVEVVASG